MPLPALVLQCAVREELLEKFPDKARRWVDVFTKADLFDAEWDFVDPDCDEAQHRAPDAIWISTKTEKNLGELMRRMLDAMERR